MQTKEHSLDELEAIIEMHSKAIAPDSPSPPSQAPDSIEKVRQFQQKMGVG